MLDIIHNLFDSSKNYYWIDQFDKYYVYRQNHIESLKGADLLFFVQVLKDDKTINWRGNVKLNNIHWSKKRKYGRCSRCYKSSLVYNLFGVIKNNRYYDLDNDEELLFCNSCKKKTCTRPIHDDKLIQFINQNKYIIYTYDIKDNSIKLIKYEVYVHQFIDVLKIWNNTFVLKICSLCGYGCDKNKCLSCSNMCINIISKRCSIIYLFFNDLLIQDVIRYIIKIIIINI